MDAPYDQCISDYKYLFNENLLKNHVAFVTGGGSGIGFTITEILMRHGCDTVIASRNKDRVDAAAKRLEAATGRRCLPLKMDVRKPQEIVAAVDEALRVYGKVNILVNNAAGNFVAPITGLSFNAYKTVLEIDTMGTFNVSKVVYEKCLRGHGGVIVNISAVLYYKGNVWQAHAGSAKAAIDALTKHMAVEWGPDLVRVVGLAPGPVGETEGVRRLGGLHGKVEDYKFPEIPLQRLSSKEEMGHAVLFLASKAAATVTGHTLVSDGGAWLSQANSMEARSRGRLGQNKTKSNL